MPSDDGSQEPLPHEDPFHHPLDKELQAEVFTKVYSMDALRKALGRFMAAAHPKRELTPDEEGWIADGMSYCFNCGLPSRSFPEYRDLAEAEGLSSTEAYVQMEEGTYNPDTNRFACDECYVEIGMPSSPNGWQAP